MLYVLCLLVISVVYLLVALKTKYYKNYTCLIGKTAIVTGGSRGIGYIVALNLASRGCKVILTSRREDESLRLKITEETGASNIICKQLDLSSLSSIRKFAKDINDNEKRLHLLINNAGVESVRSCKNTKDGLNPLMQVNYFGHFLLTNLLADLLKKSTPSRVVFVSSALTFFQNLTLENFNPQGDTNENTPSNFRSYCNSKAAVVIMSNGFAEKMRLYRVTANAVHPGLLVHTKPLNIWNICQYENGIISSIFKSLYNFILFFLGKNAEEGAQPVLRVALGKQFQTATGHFVWDLNWYPQPSCTRNRDFCKNIWEESERLVGLHPGEKLV